MRRGWHSDSARHSLAAKGVKTGHSAIHFKKGNIPDSSFNQEQLRIGMKVEREHTNDPELTKQIAKAHLSEDPNYYKKLKLMEAGGCSMSPKDDDDNGDIIPMPHPQISPVMSTKHKRYDFDKSLTAESKHMTKMKKKYKNRSFSSDEITAWDN